jgi:hypothetical protein
MALLGMLLLRLRTETPRKLPISTAAADAVLFLDIAASTLIFIRPLGGETTTMMDSARAPTICVDGPTRPIFSSIQFNPHSRAIDGERFSFPNK